MKDATVKSKPVNKNVYDTTLLSFKKNKPRFTY